MRGIPPSLSALKAEAKALKKSTGCKHHEALHQIACQYKFAHFHDAVKFYERHSPEVDQNA